MIPHLKESGGGSSKSHPPPVKAQKDGRRVVTRAQVASHPSTPCSTSSDYQNKSKRKRVKDDDGRDDMVQVKPEGIHLQKGSKAIATPASKSSTSTNNTPPQSTIGFKKMKPGSPRKAAPSKEKIASTLSTTTNAAAVCSLCQEIGHDALNCE
jgi:hypothetical protein